MAYKNPSFEPTKMILLKITGEDFIASSVLNVHKRLSGGVIAMGETPVSCAFPLKDGQLSFPAVCETTEREIVRIKIVRKRNLGI
jgi:hypothetical protein